MNRHWFLPDLGHRLLEDEDVHYYCLVCRHHITSGVHFTTNEQNPTKESQNTEDISGQRQETPESK